MNPTPKPPHPPTTPESGWPDPNFTKNQNALPLSVLEPWFGKFVACSWDGTRILAGADTRQALDEELKRLGIDSRTVVVDYVDDPAVGNFGSFIADEEDS